MPSPDGQFDAIVYEINGGATTSFGYEVDFAPHGSQNGVKAAAFYGARRNSNAYGVAPHWEGNDSLQIDYLDAKSAPKLWSPVTVVDRTFRTVLHSGVDDPHAPAGGMLYNLKHPRATTAPTATHEGTSTE